MNDLNIHATKAWYTDVLTTAQKFKRCLLADELVSLTPQALLRRLKKQMLTDEKWQVTTKAVEKSASSSTSDTLNHRFDLVGPSPLVYAVGDTVAERKLENQVK